MNLTYFRRALGLAISLLLLCAAQGCACYAFLQPFFGKTCPANYTDERYHSTGTDVTAFVVPSNMARSAMGVPIGFGVDGDKVDESFTRVSKCLGMKFEPCAVHAVFIAPNSSLSVPDPVTGKQEQIFPCNDTRANAKFCTGANQWPASIILTPDMHMLDWEVARMLTRDDPNKDPKQCWKYK